MRHARRAAPPERGSVALAHCWCDPFLRSRLAASVASREPLPRVVGSAFLTPPTPQHLPHLGRVFGEWVHGRAKSARCLFGACDGMCVGPPSAALRGLRGVVGQCHGHGVSPCSHPRPVGTNVQCPAGPGVAADFQGVHV